MHEVDVSIFRIAEPAQANFRVEATRAFRRGEAVGDSVSFDAKALPDCFAPTSCSPSEVELAGRLWDTRPPML